VVLVASWVIFVGALAYADDIVLLAATAHALRRLLSICNEHGSEYNKSFDAQKSQCLIFLSRTTQEDAAVRTSLWGGNVI